MELNLHVKDHQFRVKKRPSSLEHSPRALRRSARTSPGNSCVMIANSKCAPLLLQYVVQVRLRSIRSIKETGSNKFDPKRCHAIDNGRRHPDATRTVYIFDRQGRFAVAFIGLLLDGSNHAHQLAKCTAEGRSLCFLGRFLCFVTTTWESHVDTKLAISAANNVTCFALITRSAKGDNKSRANRAPVW